MPFRFRSGEHAFRNLHGYFCVFKPEGMAIKDLVQTIHTKLLQEINDLPNYCFETEQTCLPYQQKLLKGQTEDPKLIDAHHGSSESSVVGSNSLTSREANTNALMSIWKQEQMSEVQILNNRLVLGDRYEPEDLHLFANTGLGKYSSGVVVIGSGNYKFRSTRLNKRYMQVYHVKGRLGWASDSFYAKGRIIERSTFNHVNNSVVEKVCAAMEASHQRKMFDYAGVNPESQEAYELATKGLLRPEINHPNPILYSIKCIEFDLPHFTLEIHAINEKCVHLAELIHNLGLLMKTTAVCAGIRRIRSGKFDINYALLYQNWNLLQISNNIKRCNAIKPQPHQRKLSPTIGYLTKKNKSVIKYPKKPVYKDVPLLTEATGEFPQQSKSHEEIKKLLSSELHKDV